MTAGFYDSIKPILITNRILGVVSFKFKNGAYKEIPSNKIFKIALVIIYVSLIIPSVMLRTKEQLTSMLVLTTDIMQITTTTVQVCTVWICGAFCQREYVNFLKKIVETDQKFQQLGIWIRYDNLKNTIGKKMILHGTFVIISIALQMFTYQYTMKIILIGFNVGVYFPYLINFGIVQQITTYTLLMKERFEIINEHLVNLRNDILPKPEVKTIKLITTMLGTKLSTLRIICYLHHELTKTAKMINGVFGITMLVTFGVNFITITVSLYYFSLQLRYFTDPKDVMELFGPLTIGSTYVFDTLYLCYGCQSTVEEANSAGRLLHRIDYGDDDVKDQIEMFSLQIANENLHFTAAGFFPVDYTLIFSIIGGITTYLIILIQFSSAPY